MNKYISSTILALLILLSGCTTNTPAPLNSERPTVSPTPLTTEPQDTPSSSVLEQNHIQFYMDPDGGSMTVAAEYTKDCLPGSVFLLNRAFEVTKILCDGQEVNISEIRETYSWDDRNDAYDDPERQVVKLYRLPLFEQYVRIEYAGTLDGTSSTTSYAHEAMSSEFTLLRSENFFHPLFLESEPDSQTWPVIQAIPMDLRMTIYVPEGYTAVYAYADSTVEATSTGNAFMADMNAHYVWIAACIAKYQKVEAGSVDFYFLENSRLDASAASSPYAEEAARYWFWEYWRSQKIFLQDSVEKINIVETPDEYGGGFWAFTGGDQYNHFLMQMHVSETISETLANESIPFPAFEGDACSILFVGNSQTHRNDVPVQLQSLAGMYGIEIEFDQITPNGAGLSDTLEEALEAIKTKKYDFAIFQDSMDATSNYLDDFLSNVEVLCRAARENGATPVLYAVGVFGPPNTNYEFLTRHETRLYQFTAKKNNAVLVNVGEARLYAYQTLENLSMISDDGHFTPEGAYHVACVFASTLFNLYIQEECEANTIYSGERAIEIGQAAWEYVSWFKEHGNYPE